MAAVRAARREEYGEGGSADIALVCVPTTFFTSDSIPSLSPVALFSAVSYLMGSRRSSSSRSVSPYFGAFGPYCRHRWFSGRGTWYLSGRAYLKPRNLGNLNFPLSHLTLLQPQHHGFKPTVRAAMGYHLHGQDRYGLHEGTVQQQPHELVN